MSTDLPFYFFFGVLGVVAGALVVWFLMAEHPFEVPEELVGPVDSVEAALIAQEMTARGRPADEATVTEMLRIHAAYAEGRFDAEHQHAERDRLRAERDALRDGGAAEPLAGPGMDAPDPSAAPAGDAAAAGHPGDAEVGKTES